jgi:hypothetical protein
VDRLQNKFGLDASNPEYKDTKDIYANKVVLKINKEKKSDFHTKEFHMVCEKLYWKMANYNMIVFTCYCISKYNGRGKLCC